MRYSSVFALAAGLALCSAGGAFAQSTGAAPADPNNERNQRPAPSNTQPADPGADANPADRVPTAPDDATSAEREEGGASGGVNAPSPQPTTPPPQ